MSLAVILAWAKANEAASILAGDIEAIMQYQRNEKSAERNNCFTQDKKPEACFGFLFFGYSRKLKALILHAPNVHQYVKYIECDHVNANYAPAKIPFQ